MKKLSVLLASTAVAATFLVTPAHSAINGDNISITNRSGYAVWVTTYRAPNRRDGIVKAQCFEPGRSGLQQSTSKGGWVLFEYKASKTSCAEHSNTRVVERNVNSHATINYSNVDAD